LFLAFPAGFLPFRAECCPRRVACHVIAVQAF
jgi:hypothetical protein